MKAGLWLAVVATVVSACGGGTSPGAQTPGALPTVRAGADAIAGNVVLAGETLVAVRTLPPAALSAEKLEAAGTADAAGGERVSVARASAGGVAPWEYVSAAGDGWLVWQPKPVLDALATAGAGARIVSVEAVDWNDACLGAPRDGEVCAQVVTPGYRIIIEQGGSRIEYHAGRIAGVRRVP